MSMLIDLHVHTTFSSCSKLTVEEILANARLLGLDGVCLTDHNSIEIGDVVTEGLQNDGLLVLVGMEYSTPQGHYLAYGPVEMLPDGLDAWSLAALMESLGGVMVAAHPFRARQLSDLQVFRDRLCPVVEVENGRNTPFENEQALALAGRQGLIAVAGSDAHALDELGTAPTRFPDSIESRDDLVRALKQGRCLPAPPLQDVI